MSTKRSSTIAAELCLGLALTLSPLAALADTVVSAGGKPGIAESWTAKGTTVTLKIKSGFAPSEVADAIKKGVPGVSTQAAGQTVIVKGLDEPKLLAALERVEVSPPVEDIEGALAALQGAGGEGEDSGSSIRASKPTDLSAAEPAEATASFEGKITKVVHKKFPLVVLHVDLSAMDGAPEELKKLKKAQVVPRVALKDGRPDLADPATKANLAAWYARSGDKITLKLLVKPEGAYYVAAEYARR